MPKDEASSTGEEKGISELCIKFSDKYPGLIINLLDNLIIVSNKGLKSHLFRATIIEILGKIVIHIKDKLLNYDDTIASEMLPDSWYVTKRDSCFKLISERTRDTNI